MLFSKGISTVRTPKRSLFLGIMASAVVMLAAAARPAEAAPTSM